MVHKIERTEETIPVEQAIAQQPLAEAPIKVKEVPKEAEEEKIYDFDYFAEEYSKIREELRKEIGW